MGLISHLSLLGLGPFNPLIGRSLLSRGQEATSGMPISTTLQGREQKILNYLILEIHSNHEQRQILSVGVLGDGNGVSFYFWKLV